MRVVEGRNGSGVALETAASGQGSEATCSGSTLIATVRSNRVSVAL